MKAIFLFKNEHITYYDYNGELCWVYNTIDNKERKQKELIELLKETGQID